MDQNCKIVQDLLPLYIDSVCSEESRTYVDSHIAECPDCADLLHKLNDNTCVDDIRQETTDVVAKHAKKQKRTSAIVGMVFAGVLMIPVVICMIVNLAVGHGLSWFFIVLASLLVLASVTTVPLLVYRDKLLWTIASFTASVVLLLAVTCIYSNGRWFFIAAFGTLLGLSFPFVPIVTSKVRNDFIASHKGLCILGTYSILLVALLISISLRVNTAGFWRIAGPVVGVILLFIWVILFFAGYLKASRMTKAGCITIWCGLFYATVENLIFMLMGYSVVWHAFHPLHWTGGLINANLHWSIAILSTIIGVCLIIRGLNQTAENAVEKETENN